MGGHFANGLWTYNHLKIKKKFFLKTLCLMFSRGSTFGLFYPHFHCHYPKLVQWVIIDPNITWSREPDSLGSIPTTHSTAARHYAFFHARWHFRRWAPGDVHNGAVFSLKGPTLSIDHRVMTWTIRMQASQRWSDPCPVPGIGTTKLKARVSKEPTSWNGLPILGAAIQAFKEV